MCLVQCVCVLSALFARHRTAFESSFDYEHEISIFRCLFSEMRAMVRGMLGVNAAMTIAGGVHVSLMPRVLSSDF